MKKPYQPIDLPRHVRASQLPKKGPLFWAMVFVTIFWAAIGVWLYGMV